MHVLKVMETVATAVSLLKDLDTLVPVAILEVNWGHGVKTIGFGENEMALYCQVRGRTSAAKTPAGVFLCLLLQPQQPQPQAEPQQQRQQQQQQQQQQSVLCLSSFSRFIFFLTNDKCPMEGCFLTQAVEWNWISRLG